MKTALATSSSCQPSAIASPSSISIVLQRWRRQIASRSELAERRGPRPFALIGYRVSGRFDETLVPLERLSFVVLFDERDDDDCLATRLLAFRASGDTTGLRVGGVERTLFDKNIRLAPATQSGARLDPRDAELCELAFGWEQYLERVNRHPHYPRRNVIRWPHWYAEVPSAAAGGASSEFIPWEVAVAQRLPIVRAWADVAGMPKRQIVTGEPRRVLCGVQGPLVFDLYHSHFRRTS